MDIKSAEKIVIDNCLGGNDSFVYKLNSESVFSKESFWLFYDSIAYLVENGVKTDEITKCLCIGYQRVLQEFIYHFSPVDVAQIEGFPENYNDYIEKLDFAILAYFDGNQTLIENERFDLQQ